MRDVSQIIKNLLLPLLAAIALSGSKAYSADSFLLGTAPHKRHTIEDIRKIGEKNQAFAGMFTNAFKKGFRPLTSNWGNEKYRPLRILPLQNQVVTKQVLEFKMALESEKQNLMRIYKLKNATYNKLAAMALGIYGNESEFGTSFRLKLKENFQDLVVLGKMIKGQKNLTTSRGGTQIKDLPAKIKQHYSITSDDLVIPFNSAVATIGFLTQTFSMLLERDDLENINASNVFDYMPYVYSGQMYKILEGTATVRDNSYVVGMKHNIRKFYFMERAQK